MTAPERSAYRYGARAAGLWIGLLALAYAPILGFLAWAYIELELAPVGPGGDLWLWVWFIAGAVGLQLLLGNLVRYRVSENGLEQRFIRSRSFPWAELKPRISIPGGVLGPITWLESREEREGKRPKKRSLWLFGTLADEAAFLEDVREHAPAGAARGALLARRAGAHSRWPAALGAGGLSVFVGVLALVIAQAEFAERAALAHLRAAIEQRMARPPLTVSLPADGSGRLGIAPDGRWATHGGVVWEAETGREVTRAFPAGLGPEGRMLFPSAVLDAPTGEWTPLRTSFLDPSVGGAELSLSPDGSLVAAGGWFGVTVFDARTGAVRARLSETPFWRRALTSMALLPFGPTSDVVSWARISPDNHLVAGYTRGDWRPAGDGTFEPHGRELHVWRLEDGELVARIPENDLGSVGFPASGDRILLAIDAEERREVQEWSLASGERVRTIPAGSAARMAVSADGRWILRAERWDGFEGERDPVFSIVYLRRIVVSDAATDSEQWRLEPPGIGHLEWAFSPDGSLLLLHDPDGDVTLTLDAATGGIRSMRYVETVESGFLGVSPDGRRIYARHGVWDLESGRLERPLAEPGDRFYDLEIDDSGTLATIARVTREDEPVLSLWNAELDVEVASFDVDLSEDGPLPFDGRPPSMLDQSVRFLLFRRYSSRGHYAFSTEVSLHRQRQSVDGRWHVELAADDEGASFAGLWRITGPEGSWTWWGDSELKQEGDGFVVDPASLYTEPGALNLLAPGDSSRIATLYVFANGDWAAVDSLGRYDAANGGAIDGMHFVVGMEPVGLEQLRDRYYEPGLLAKHLKHNPEPLRDVDAFADVALYPGVRVLRQPDEEAAELRIRLLNRGGGIGRVALFLNGKELTGDARPAGADPAEDSLDIAIDLAGHPFLAPGADNRVEVVAYNAEGYLASRRRGFELGDMEEDPDLPAPRLWVIVAGVSDYTGTELDLRYAAKDAVDAAEALQVAAAGLFGPERVHVRLLTTDVAEGPGSATRENILAALDEVQRRAAPSDVLAVYLAGHGITHGGPDGDYYFLTREAATGDLSDPAVRARTAISSHELTERLTAITALKQLLILDTCGSGRVIEDITAQRSVPSSQVRAIRRMTDRAGLFVLAGSAADAVSYEATRFAQGLLTHALLLGMKGSALRDDRFVDVATWFEFAASEVPLLARDIGGVQRPELALPTGGGSFDVGILTAESRQRIPLETPRPLVVRANFQDERRFQDHLGLTQRVNDGLRESAFSGRGGSIVFVDAAELPGAHVLAGRYRVEAGEVVLDARIFDGEEVVASFVVRGPAANLEVVADATVQRVEAVLRRAS